MRILFTCQRFGKGIIGGSETATRHFAEKLVELGHQVTVLTSCATSYATWANHYEPGVYDENGVAVVRLSVVTPRDSKTFDELHKTVLERAQTFRFEEEIWAQRIGPELDGYLDWLDIHIESFDAMIFKSYLYFPTTQGLPFIAGRIPTVFHPEAHPEAMLDVGLYDGIFRLPDAFQFGTPEEAELVRQRFGFSPVGKVVGVGIDPPDNLPQQSPAICLPDSPYVVVLGRYGVGKGSQQALEFLQKYRHKTGTKIRLVFIGEKPEELPEVDGVVFVGYLDEEEKRYLLANSLCLLQPSLLESFSIVVIEAWNLGVPVLADGRCAAVAGQVNRAGGGLLYEDFGSFETALNSILVPSKREKLACAGEAYVAANYRWPQVCDRLLEVIALARARFDLR